MKKNTSLQNETETYPMRLNRFMALRGLSTRRGADELIAAGLVSIDGRVATLGDRVLGPDARVTLKAEAKALEKHLVYFAYYKPRGIITHSPQRHEQSIAEVSGIKGVFPIGRLDKDSEGLILLTNDGRITERLLSPRFEHEKEYLVTIKESWPRGVEARLKEGIEENGELLKVKQCTLRTKHEATLILTEGKKHQIRRMLAACNLTILELKRVRIMGVHLGALRPGEKRALAGKARTEFLRDLGLGEK